MADLQFIEASVIGIRSAVIILKHRVTPLRFLLIPMVHVAEPQFYRENAELAGTCGLIVAEGAPSRYREERLPRRELSLADRRPRPRLSSRVA